MATALYRATGTHILELCVLGNVWFIDADYSSGLISLEPPYHASSLFYAWREFVLAG